MEKTNNPNQYHYYNAIDFDEYMQQEFIEWLNTFSYKYIRLVFDYYKNVKKNGDEILEKIYNGFDDIIEYEKTTIKKNKIRW